MTTESRPSWGLVAGIAAFCAAFCAVLIGLLLYVLLSIPGTAVVSTSSVSPDDKQRIREFYDESMAAARLIESVPDIEAVTREKFTLTHATARMPDDKQKLGKGVVAALHMVEMDLGIRNQLQALEKNRVEYEKRQGEIKAMCAGHAGLIRSMIKPLAN
jgi:hypothetical protein